MLQQVIRKDLYNLIPCYTHKRKDLFRHQTRLDLYLAKSGDPTRFRRCSPRNSLRFASVAGANHDAIDGGDAQNPRRDFSTPGAQNRTQVFALVWRLGKRVVGTR